MKKSPRHYLALPALAMLGLAGCQPAEAPKTTETKVEVKEEAPATSNEVNLYTERHYDADQKLFDQFKEATGIQVNVVKAKADELIERLKAEGDQSQADLFLTVDAGRMGRAKEAGLLQTVDSEALNSQIPEAYRDPEGQWFGLTKRGRVFVYAKDRVQPEELTTYEALVDPKWKGRILVRSSTNKYNQALIASLIAANGVEATEEWAKGIVANLAREPKGNDRDQMRAVAAGEGDVAIVNTYYLGLLAGGNEADQAVAEQLAIVFPNQEDRGTHVNISSAALTKNAPNKENAVKLLEFLTSTEAQQQLTEANYEYPINPAVPPVGLVQSWGTFKEEPVDAAAIGQNEDEALKLGDRAGWR